MGSKYTGRQAQVRAHAGARTQVQVRRPDGLTADDPAPIGADVDGEDGLGVRAFELQAAREVLETQDPHLSTPSN